MKFLLTEIRDCESSVEMALNYCIMIFCRTFTLAPIFSVTFAIHSFVSLLVIVSGNSVILSQAKMTRGITPSKSTNHGRATTNEQASQSDDFFQTRVVSEKESCGVMKRLTAITISTILYHRNMFPASDYGQRSHRGQVFHILDKKAQTPQARQVVSLVQSLFEPIDQKYLKSVVIGFTEDQNNPNDLIEAYIIHYQYSNGEVSVTRYEFKK